MDRDYKKEELFVKEITEKPNKYFEDLPSVKKRYLKMRDTIKTLLETVDTELDQINHIEWIDRNDYSWKVFSLIKKELLTKIKNDKEIWDFYIFLFSGAAFGSFEQREERIKKFIKSKLPFLCKLIYSIDDPRGTLTYNGQENVIVMKYSLRFLFWSTKMTMILNMNDLKEYFKEDYVLFVNKRENNLL